MAVLWGAQIRATLEPGNKQNFYLFFLFYTQHKFFHSLQTLFSLSSHYCWNTKLSCLLVLYLFQNNHLVWNSCGINVTGAYLGKLFCTNVHKYEIGLSYEHYQVVGHVECVQAGKISNWLQLVNLVEMLKKSNWILFQVLACIISSASYWFLNEVYEK